MISKSPVVIYAENTPNPEAMKFVANKMLLPDHLSFEFKNKADAQRSNLAISLFEFPFIQQVFLAANYVTITKNKMVEWPEVINHLREFVKLFLEEGREVLDNVNQLSTSESPHTMPNSEIEGKIIAVLEEYISPAVAQDGGFIAFKSFINGIVSVELKGSCAGCPSSTLTLKAGIEGLLKRMVPEVIEVRSIAN